MNPGDLATRGPGDRVAWWLPETMRTSSNDSFSTPMITRP